MSVIAARRYTSGMCSQSELTVDGQPREGLPEGSFDWVGVSHPTDEEMDLVRHQFGLHKLAVEDALDGAQLPKAEVYGKQLFIIARTAEMLEGEKIEYGQTAIFLGRDFIVTVRLGSTREHMPLRDKLEHDVDHLAEGPDYVAHAILDFLVDGYQPLMDQLEAAVQAMEEASVEAFPDPSTIRRIFHLRRQLRRFERIVGPMETVCDRLVRHQLAMVDPEARVWFRDVLDHVQRTLARAVGLKDTLATIVETASLLEQHRQGEMTRQLAGWAAILAVPTAIAGIYGMNFQFMPELQWHYAYFVVLGAIVTICTGLWLRFRQIGWL